jgi:hypothetical protein
MDILWPWLYLALGGWGYLAMACCERIKVDHHFLEALLINAQSHAKKKMPKSPPRLKAIAYLLINCIHPSLENLAIGSQLVVVLIQARSPKRNTIALIMNMIHKNHFIISLRGVSNGYYSSSLKDIHIQAW